MDSICRDSTKASAHDSRGSEIHNKHNGPNAKMRDPSRGSLLEPVSSVFDDDVESGILKVIEVAKDGAP